MRAAWLSEAVFAVAVLIAAVLLKLILGGALALWTLFALAVVIGRHLYQLYRLEHWLRVGRSRNPPKSWGIWGEVFDHYYRLQQRYYKRKKRLSKVINEFRESTAAMPDGTVVLDVDWRILWFNEAAERLLRLDGKRDRGQTVTSLLRSPELERFLHKHEFSEALEIPSPAASRRTLSLRVVPYGHKQYLLLVRDITRIRRLEAMRRDFVANASHELRSPLTVLAGYLEGLGEDEDFPENWREPLEEMRLQCQRMTALVNDLLELSRMEIEENEAPEDNPVDVPAMIQRIVREARSQDEGRRRIEAEIDDSLWLSGSEGELHSAFSNLVFNAVRYTEPDGSIRIRWAAGEGGQAVFEVTDDGIGIEAKHLPFITQRFYRVDSARSRSYTGSGLGLAIVKHVLERHQGRLEVESEPGEGSTFRCLLPAPRRLAAPSAPPAELSLEQ